VGAADGDPDAITFRLDFEPEIGYDFQCGDVLVGDTLALDEGNTDFIRHRNTDSSASPTWWFR